jgi:TonB family protein
MRRVPRAVVALFAVWSAVGLAQTPQSKPPEEPWPPPGVLLPGARGLTPPQLVTSIQPQYTAEAMRARIQGTVRLSCVVEPDGSIGPVRVVKSLDTKFGLDEQAIATARKWKFTPGMKDGKPVRVLITLDLGFALHDGPAVESKWPSEFPVPVTAMLRSADWRHDTIDLPHLVIALDFPKGWTGERPADPKRPLQVSSADHLRGLAVAVPGILPGPVLLPMPAPQLEQFTAQMSAQTAGRDLKALGVGQVQTPSGWWVWQEFEFGADHLTKLMPGFAVPAGTGITARLWMFTTVASSHMVNLFCVAVTSTVEAGAPADAEWRRAGALFQEIVQRVSFQAR